MNTLTDLAEAMNTKWELNLANSAIKDIYTCLSSSTGNVFSLFSKILFAEFASITVNLAYSLFVYITLDYKFSLTSLHDCVDCKLPIICCYNLLIKFINTSLTENNFYIGFPNLTRKG